MTNKFLCKNWIKLLRYIETRDYGSFWSFIPHFQFSAIFVSSAFSYLKANCHIQKQPQSVQLIATFGTTQKAPHMGIKKSDQHKKSDYLLLLKGSKTSENEERLFEKNQKHFS